MNSIYVLFTEFCQIVDRLLDILRLCHVLWLCGHILRLRVWLKYVLNLRLFISLGLVGINYLWLLIDILLLLWLSVNNLVRRLLAVDNLWRLAPIYIDNIFLRGLINIDYFFPLFWWIVNINNLFPLLWWIVNIDNLFLRFGSRSVHNLDKFFRILVNYQCPLQVLI
ncbi:hypothetical protein BpHYR1_031070 [Brachionus plicatilis]|uniref:Uncharacterized protein n=1 Tax=Brachionus plicatilis TaxID=10195 RepID=A0A3M7RXV5_BRAPC|nr:hypothetical protein BpHYR1_031070 [Brachionus plicatilis]